MPDVVSLGVPGPDMTLWGTYENLKYSFLSYC